MFNQTKVNDFIVQKFKFIMVGFFLFSLLVSSIIILENIDNGLAYTSFGEESDMHSYLVNALNYEESLWPGEKPYYRAPLFSYFLGITLTTFGSIYAVYFLHCLLMAISLVLIIYTTKLLFGVKESIISGFIYLLYGGSWMWAGVLHSTVLEIFFASLFATLLVIWQMRIKVSQRIKFLDVSISVSLGVAYTLLCLVRPNFLLVAPFFIIGFLIQYSRKWKFTLSHLLVIIITWVAISSPIILHNYKVTDELSWYTTNGRETYVIANSEDSPVYNFVYPKGRLLEPTEFKYWNKQFQKFLGYWKNWEYPQNVSYYLFRENSNILSLLVLPFSLIGAFYFLSFFRIKEHFSESWPIILTFVLYYASISFFFIIGRFRLPGLVFMIPLAAFALVSLFEYFQVSKKRFYFSSLFVLGFLFLSKPFEEPPRSNYATKAAQGCILFGQYEKSINFFEEAYSINGDFNSAVGLAVSTYISGDYEYSSNILATLLNEKPKDIVLRKAYFKALQKSNKKRYSLVDDKRIPDLLEGVKNQWNKKQVTTKDQFGKYLPADF